MQSTIFTAVATALCAACSMFYAIALRRLWKIKWKLLVNIPWKISMNELRSASELKREKMLAVSGIALFLSQCTMTAYYVVVTFTAVDNVIFIPSSRSIFSLMLNSIDHRSSLSRSLLSPMLAIFTCSLYCSSLSLIRGCWYSRMGNCAERDHRTLEKWRWWNNCRVMRREWENVDHMMQSNPATQ